ncbi:MAG TPA: ergothioneine biosynthesis protein EgtC [Jatrophihabitantaceae bacterium]|jgi:glutamine amidotransferase|nr:ergothioneine biosynthesis protein EgtC [Jatrophihabitantaceae bacterium]
MCRHLAYLGPPVPLARLLLEPEYALLRQSWQPRRQAHGRLNADGFGIGWYVEGLDEPARYRRAVPMWTDANVPELARVTRSGAVLAAVRSATAGMGQAESAAAPFKYGRWLFSHNGALPGWPESGALVAAALPSTTLLTMDAPSDAALLWTFICSRLLAGDALGMALSAAVSIAAPTGGRLNFLLTDGVTIAATTWGDTLSWRADQRGVFVASEPFDDEPGWHDVTDRSLLISTPDGVEVTPLILVPPIEGVPQ